MLVLSVNAGSLTLWSSDAVLWVIPVSVLYTSPSADAAALELTLKSLQVCTANILAQLVWNPNYNDFDSSVVIILNP